MDWVTILTPLHFTTYLCVSVLSLFCSYASLVMYGCQYAVGKSINSLPEAMTNMLAALRLTSLIVYTAIPLSIKYSNKHMQELHQLAKPALFSIYTDSTWCFFPWGLLEDLRSVFNFNQTTSLEPVHHYSVALY